MRPENIDRKKVLLNLVRLFFISITALFLWTVHDSTQNIQIQKTYDGFHTENMDCYEREDSEICYATYKILDHDTHIPIIYAVYNPEGSRTIFDYSLEIAQHSYRNS